MYFTYSRSSPLLLHIFTVSYVANLSSSSPPARKQQAQEILGRQVQMPVKPAQTVRPAYKFASKKLTVATTLHPLALLAFYASQWPKLLADPVSSLRFSLIPLSVIQIAYAHTCLETQAPSTTSPAPGSSSAASRKPKPGPSRLGPGGTKRTGTVDAGTGLSEDLLVR